MTRSASSSLTCSWCCSRRYRATATVISSPPTLLVRWARTPPKQKATASAVPPPTSTTMCTRRSSGSMPQPTAPATGSSSAVTGRMPASCAASRSARVSSAVESAGTPITARTGLHARRPARARTARRYSAGGLQIRDHPVVQRPDSGEPGRGATEQIGRFPPDGLELRPARARPGASA